MTKFGYVAPQVIQIRRSYLENSNILPTEAECDGTLRFTEEESSEVQDCVSSEPCYSLVENIPLFHLDCENYKGMDEVSGATPIFPILVAHTAPRPSKQSKV